MDNGDDVLTLEEACDTSKIDERVIKRALENGALMHGRVGTGPHAPYRITRRALLNWVDDGCPGTGAPKRETT